MAKFYPLAYAKGVLRRACKKCPPHYEAVNKAKKYYSKKNKDGSVCKRKFVKFKCAMCKASFPQKEIEVDHITPIGLNFESFEDWTVALIMGDRQILCKKCHKKKTKKDKKRIKTAKEEATANEISSGAHKQKQ
jgi:5-methylcytosine-specific restriction endonuclease McrA